MRTRIRPALLALVLIPLLSTCGGGGEPGGPTPLALKTIAVPTGSVPGGATIAPAVRVGLVGAGNALIAVSGVPVTVALGSPGQSIAGTLTVLTDEDGVAHFEDLVVTGTAGLCRFSFSSPDLPTLLTPYFQLAGGAPQLIALLSVDSQTAMVTLDTLPIPPKVAVRDAWGNAVAGVSLTVAVTAGGGSVTTPAGGFVTNGLGQVTIAGWRLGAAPTLNRLAVTVTGNGAIPAAEFRVLGVVGPASRVQLSAPPATAVVDSTLFAPTIATVTDGRGNPIPEIEVTFHHGAGAALTGDIGFSDGAGHVTLGSWHLSTVAGANEVYATIDGATSTTITTTGVAGPPMTIRQGTPSPLTAVGIPTFVRFQALDRFGNAAPGAQMSLAVTTGTATLAPTTISGGLDGAEQATITPTAPGPLEVTASLVVRPDSQLVVAVPVVAPTAILVVGGDSQTVRAGTITTQPVRVRVVDDSGRGVAGVPLEQYWWVTDSAGEASIELVAKGVVGAERVALTSPWLPADTGWTTLLVVPGPIVTITQIRGASAAEVGTPVDTLPIVQATDQFGNFPVGDKLVWGNGDTTLVDSLGHSSPDEWILGSTAGTQYLNVRAVSWTGSFLYVETVAIPGPVFTIAILQGGGVGGFAGESPGVVPIFYASDKFGNSTAGRPFTASITDGGGTLVGVPAAFDSAGKVTIDGWTLGAGRNELTVTANSHSSALVIDAGPPSAFNITLRGVAPGYQSYFNAAVYRWRRVIRNDLPDQAVSVAADACGPQAFNGTVDDLVIDVVIGPIDGPGGILGGAGPCVVRAGAGLPVLGVMIFDQEDIAYLIGQGTFDDVLLHEMGHVLGIGSLWSERGLSVTSSSDPYFTGSSARGQFLALGGGSYTGNRVPIENGGGAGTVFVHWRESVLPSELMTGYLSAAFNPLSTITAGSLTDLGYIVDLSEADNYTLFTAPPAAGTGAGTRIHDQVFGPRYETRPNGRVVAIPPR